MVLVTFSALVDVEALPGCSLRTPIPNVMNVICTNDSTKGWVVYPYTHGLHDCSSKALPLPTHYTEFVQCGGVASHGMVAMHGIFKCSLNLSTNVLILLCTHHHNPTPGTYTYFSVPWGSLSIGEIQMFFNVLLPLKKVWLPYLMQMFMKLSCQPYIYGITMYPLDLFLMFLLLFLWLLLLLLLLLFLLLLLGMYW